MEWWDSEEERELPSNEDNTEDDSAFSEDAYDNQDEDESDIDGENYNVNTHDTLPVENFTNDCVCDTTGKCLLSIPTEFLEPLTSYMRQKLLQVIRKAYVGGLLHAIAPPAEQGKHKLSYRLWGHPVCAEGIQAIFCVSKRVLE